MKEIQYATIFSFLFAFSISGFVYTAGQKGDNEIAYKNYINGNLDAWKLIIDRQEELSKQEEINKLQLLDLYYAYTAWLISEEKDEDADIFINKAQILIQHIFQDSSDNATAYAYQGAFIAYEIALTPYKAIILGPKSIDYITKSLALDPENIQGNIEKGNASYYTPVLFGGSKAKAAEAYKRAILLMEKNKLTHHNWRYLNCMAMLAQSYHRSGKIKKADEMYTLILALEPNFKWVKEELYPQFLKQK